MDVIRFTQSVMAIMIASGLAKFGNENYETLKADGSVLLPAICLLAAIALFIFGIRRFAHAFSRR